MSQNVYPFLAWETLKSSKKLIQVQIIAPYTYPNWFLSISDPGSNNSTKRGRGEKFVCPSIFCSHKYLKIVKSYIFEQGKKCLYSQTLRIIVLFTQIFVIKLSKICFWDPGYRTQGQGSGSAGPQHCIPMNYKQAIGNNLDSQWVPL
jgi:hypothetical protein